jgi:hypothetical protein
MILGFSSSQRFKSNSLELALNFPGSEAENVKLSLCLIKHYAMKVYGGVVV